MALGTGICAGKIVAGVLGIGAASVLGFNWVTTGCPSGVCPTERAPQSTVIATSLNPTEAATGTTPDSCCPLMASEARVETVAATTEACAAEAAGCCENPPEACCSQEGAEAPCDEAKACCQENFGLAASSGVKP